MSRSRRTLFLAIAGFVVLATSGAAQAPESRPDGRSAKVDAALALSSLKEAVDAAKAKEASGDKTQALVAYDEAVAKFNKLFEKDSAPAAPIVELYKQLLAESDRLVDNVETPEFEAKIPERDLFSPNEDWLWGASVGATKALKDGTLTIESAPAANSRLTGVVSALPRRDVPWHDVVIDLEFTILAGDFELYVRYWPDRRSYLIKFDAASGYGLNKAYRMTIRVKGSSITLKQPDQPVNADTLVATTSRTGGIGFGVKRGTKVAISKLTLKVLR